MTKQQEIPKSISSLHSRLCYHGDIAAIHHLAYQTQNYSDMSSGEQQIIFSMASFAIGETKENNGQVEHFFEAAENQYKSIDGLVKINKENCPSNQLKFLLQEQYEARHNIILLHQTKYNRAIEIIKNCQNDLDQRLEEITRGLANLRMEIDEADGKIGKLKKELESAHVSFRQNLDEVHRQDLTDKKVKAATDKFSKPFENISKKIADETNNRGRLQSEIDILNIEETSAAQASDILSKKEKLVTENYLRIYCNYRQNWIRDDGANSNIPSNCEPLNFKISEFNLDGVDFSNIPITFAELASADSGSIGKIIGLGYKQVAILFMKKDVDREQKSQFLMKVEARSLEDKQKMIMQIVNARPDDMASDMTNIIYNIDDELTASKSYQIWLQQKDSAKEIGAESKSEKNSPDLSSGSPSKSETKKLESPTASLDPSPSPTSFKNPTLTKPSGRVEKYSSKVRIWSGKLLMPPDKTYGPSPD